MTKYLLDTNHAGRLLRQDSESLWSRLSSFDREECVLCRPVVAELYFMVYNSQRVEANRQRLESLLAQFDVLEFDAPAAIEFGRLRALLRQSGRPLPVFNILIAAIAISAGCTLVTADAHFENVRGLPAENWLE